MRVMSRFYVKLKLGNVGSINVEISALDFFIGYESFQLAADSGAFRQPHRESLAAGFIYVKIPVSFSRAVLGDEIEVPTLDGKNILLKVLPGTESGKVLRILGKGIPHFSGTGRGDLYIELIIKTPKKITKKQKGLLEKLREEGI